MKRYLGIVFAIAFVVVAVWFASSKYSAKASEALRIENAARIKVEYLERVGWIRSNPDERSYREEVTTFFRWYFNQVNDHINRFGGDRDFDDYLAELEKRATGDSQAAEKKANYERTKKIFDLMRGGSYSPIWSASDKGMRLDVLSTSQVTNAGEAQVRYQLVLWGAQRELREEGDLRKTKRMITSASFNVVWKMFDEKDKLIGEMTAAGDPAGKVDFPERYIEHFPPQMVLGHFDVDLIPAEVKRMEIGFSVSSRSQSGGDALASFPWKLDAPAEWKLRPGESWKGAQESVRPQDEIDPSKRAQR